MITVWSYRLVARTQRRFPVSVIRARLLWLGYTYYAVYNIGNNNPENLLDFVQILQEALIRAEVLPADYDFESHKELVPMQPGDVPMTFAFKPSTSSQGYGRRQSSRD